MSASRIIVPLGTSAALYLVYKTYHAMYYFFTSPLRQIPRLPGANIFMGNMKEIMLMDPTAEHERFVTEFGTTFRFKALLWEDWLFTADIKAISYILKKDTGKWQKPTFFSRILLPLIGPGLALVDSDVHKQQRKILNPAFSTGAIKRFTETFLDKAMKLKDNWLKEIDKDNREEVQIDVFSWLCRATLDIIGETGFGYEFNSLEAEEGNELQKAFSTILQVGTKRSIVRLVRGMVAKAARFLPIDLDRETTQAREIMNRIGKQLLKERELAFASENSGGIDSEEKDILSLLARVNTLSDVDQQLPEEQILAQIPTFIVAGHETTSTATAWALFSLAQETSMQARLRGELLSLPTDSPSMEDLNALPYLDAIVRETLRFHSPVPFTLRIPVEDDVLPLQTPVIDFTGGVHHQLKVRKGQTVFISLAMVNRLETIWGKDAGVFNPDRWKSTPEAAMAIPGVWGNLLSFFGGPRACIGYRFSLIEMKALLFTLIRVFEFKLAVPATDILRRSEFVIRPVLKGGPGGSNQLPMLIQRVKQ